MITDRHGKPIDPEGYYLMEWPSEVHTGNVRVLYFGRNIVALPRHAIVTRLAPAPEPSPEATARVAASLRQGEALDAAREAAQAHEPHAARDCPDPEHLMTPSGLSRDGWTPDPRALRTYLLAPDYEID